jgi:hypothetical protein
MCKFQIFTIKTLTENTTELKIKDTLVRTVVQIGDLGFLSEK